MAHWTIALTWIIFALTYGGLALGRIPGLRTDRAGIALVGATLLLLGGAVTLDEAVSPRSIDYKTLLLLFGMMIVVGALRLSGFFERLTGLALRHIATPRGMLAATIGLAGLLSAFLINDVVCVALTPLVLHVARRLKFDPLPHLIGLATAANIGSTGTITGNPQNIYIGAHAGISYLHFAARLMPVALLGLVIDYLVITVVYRGRLTAGNGSQPLPAESPKARTERDGAAAHRRAHARLQRKAVTVTVAAVVLFFTGLPLELVALGAAGVMLLGRVNPRKIYHQVDWSLLVMFAGLFVVVHAFQMYVVAGWQIDRWTWLLDRPIDLLSLVSAGLSNLVSNVPAVLLLEPVAQAVPAGNREAAWLALAMSSTLAGNLTVLGSVANLIVVENAKHDGLAISFWQYCKVGIPVTLLTLGLGIAWLEFVRY
ncbi:MAG TPA: anion transporter [Pirellulales bacterium]|nr:anion transporter [Pirellulales bacterium]